MSVAGSSVYVGGSIRAAVRWQDAAQFPEFNLHILTATCQRTSERQRGGRGEGRGMWQHGATLTMAREKTAADWELHTQRAAVEERLPPVQRDFQWVWDKSDSLPAGGWELFIQWAAIEKNNGRRESWIEGGKEGWPGEKQNRAERKTRAIRSNRNEFSEAQHF